MNSPTEGHVVCHTCGESCTGEVLKVQDQYFHAVCFVCKVCSKALAGGGFFVKENEFYCASDYQQLYGTKCVVCGDYVEGEVVTAMGNTYHQHCFVCSKCKSPFPAGEKVLFDGSGCVCHQCAVGSGMLSPTKGGTRQCAGCSEMISNGQVLLALDKPWHVYCFKCHHCQCMLSGEYMGKDGLPYCEADYQTLFGVKCHVCQDYITGKVIQAGEQHYHPECAKCSKCMQNFGEGEEMFTQGSEVWHPSCAAAPQSGEENSVPLHEQMRPSPASESSGSYVSSAMFHSPAAEVVRHEAKANVPQFLSSQPENEQTTSSHNGPFGGVSSSVTLGGVTSSTRGLDEDIRPRRKSFLSDILTDTSTTTSRKSEGNDRLSGRESTPTDPVQMAKKPSAASSGPVGSGFRRLVSGEGQTDTSSVAVSGTVQRSSSSQTAVEPTRMGSGSPEPQAMYPLEQLQGQGSYKLPKGVDRTRLEDYLSDSDFKLAFKMTRDQFSRLAAWRQKDMKRRAKLF